ncbi:dihydrofolate reductase family protein [Cellulomonas cellasea]|uniref:Dihydrofolate reductase n=1 Tax=Cellulomonas cellasea TaxID=43670 RepID=A0A7W4UFS1_9CELL|nr:dihydrofolate reductase family protein [Cellulomonas cellasea]MBB2923391.1 dihydrofolate reductase [Cellulomonas cellasea]
MTTDRAWTGCVFIGVSLDGYIAKPDGDLAWLTDPAPRDHVVGTADRPALVWETFYPGVDVLVMGRATYETAVGFDAWPYAGKDVVVLSTTLPDDDDRVRVARSLEEVRALLAGLGATRVYVDGGRTVQSFLSAGLVDELTVAIAPVLLGRGARLFGELDHDVLLTLRGSHATADDGLVRITYAVTGR